MYDGDDGSLWSSRDDYKLTWGTTAQYSRASSIRGNLEALRTMDMLARLADDVVFLASRQIPRKQTLLLTSVSSQQRLFSFQGCQRHGCLDHLAEDHHDSPL